MTDTPTVDEPPVVSVDKPTKFALAMRIGTGPEAATFARGLNLPDTVHVTAHRDGDSLMLWFAIPGGDVDKPDLQRTFEAVGVLTDFAGMIVTPDNIAVDTPTIATPSDPRSSIVLPPGARR